MKKDRKVKNYWIKKKEGFADSTEAKSRAGQLRSYKHVAHVTVRKCNDKYVVSYSVAKWFLDELSSAGIDL